MGNRLGRIAGVSAFGLMMVRLARLILTGDSAPAWHLIMIASAFLGGVIWWLLKQTVSGRRAATGLFVLAGLILFFRISVPDTLLIGFVPTPDTFDTLGREMGTSMDLIRFGVAPITPTAGVVAILSGLMWITGGLFVWGATEGPAIAMSLPSLGLYLQFAVMDRLSAGLGWMIASSAVIALTVIAVALERRHEAGRVRNVEGRPIPRQVSTTAFLLAAVVGLGAIATAISAADLVPANGNLRWRLGSGYGQGYGGVSFDRLADLQQRIITRSNAVMFTAVLDENAPPADEIYWRMETLDIFDGAAWRPSGVTTSFFQPGAAGGNQDHAYRGTSQQIAARVKIDQLRSEVVPTAGIAYDVAADLVNMSILQVATDGSLIYRPGLNQGDEYVVELAVLPLEDQDLGALATLDDGTLSPLFANAAGAGLFSNQPEARALDLGRPADIERFLVLPDNLPIGIRAEALARTEGAVTDFEAAWLLQHWFRDSGDFSYSTTVSSGHDSLDLENWLTDSTSLNYRVGYCEQFAASMAVLGRTLGIPSRVVWGFTPGETVAQSDGTEAIVVRDNNAHAWVEMWMDGFGWVAFDPTPRGGGVLPQSITAAFDPVEFLPPVDTPDRNLDGPDFSGRPELPEGEIPGGVVGAQGSFPWQWLVILPLVGLAFGAVPWLKSMRRRRRLARLREGDITAAWDEIVDRLGDLGQPVPPHETPMEFATRTDETLVSLASSYSAAVYGGRNGMATEYDLEVIEDWLRRRYEAGLRTRAMFNPRSLLNRR